jgi:hypothetical protein
MSRATEKPQPLTTISGGINRLKTKGGAARDALFDLVNAYVTAANTVVPRPGTDRNADLSALAPAGATKGLVGYQGQLHVFSASVVTVPAGYQLHVLTHPATQYTATVATTVNSYGSPGSVTYNSETVYGASDGAVAPALNSGRGCGPVGGAIGTSGYYISAVLSNARNPSNIYLILSGTLSKTAFDSVSYHNDVNGNLTTLTSASAASFSTSGGYSIWEWTGATDFNPGPYPGFTITNFTYATPIPIKEIHFASPFMGVLYVVAEFSVADPTVLAQYGSVFHYWIQGGSTWVASKDRLIGDIVVPSVLNGLAYVASRHGTPNPVWAPSVLHSVGDKVEPTVPNGFYFTAITTEGANPVSGATEPTWPTTDNATVTENSAIDSDQVASLVTAAPQPSTNVPSSPITKRYGNPAGGFGI